MKTFRQIILISLILLLMQSLSGREKIQSPQSLQEAYAAVAQKTFPAVVVLENYRHNGISLVRNGVGSGFFVRADGYIATNFHVIKNAAVIMVKLSDQERVPAKIIGIDSKLDIAVIRIYVKRKLPFLKFADTAKVKVGHYAIAIGAPFALSHTMTTGIVSHKGRKLNGDYYEEYIQTDASVNPGNSGGPLLNIDGKVIGINSTMLSPDGQSNVGIGFAIDGNLAKKRIDTIIRYSSQYRPFAGFGMLDTNPPGKGVIISRIVKNSPAENAGLQSGDLIVKIDSHPIPNIHDLQSVIMTCYNPGDIADFTLIRKRKVMKIKLKFEKGND